MSGGFPISLNTLLETLVFAPIPNDFLVGTVVGAGGVVAWGFVTSTGMALYPSSGFTYGWSGAEVAWRGASAVVYVPASSATGNRRRRAKRDWRGAIMAVCGFAAGTLTCLIERAAPNFGTTMGWGSLVGRKLGETVRGWWTGEEEPGWVQQEMAINGECEPLQEDGEDV